MDMLKTVINILLSTALLAGCASQSDYWGSVANGLNKVANDKK